MKRIPKYCFYTAFLLIIADLLTYYLSQLLTKNRELYDLTIHAIDDKVPFLSFFIVFYILSYVFWFITPIINYKLTKKDYLNWVISALVSFLVIFIIFLIIPTTITRPVVDNSNVFNWLVNIIYESDSPERPINLFPSIHCFFSWACYISIRGKKQYSLWYRISCFTMAVLICLSTQFVKQHYIVDLISAIFIAEAFFFITNKINPAKYFFGGAEDDHRIA